MWCTTYFDTMNCLSMNHQCEGQTDRQTATTHVIMFSGES